MKANPKILFLAGALTACATTDDKNPYDTDTDIIDTDTEDTQDTDDTDVVDTDTVDTDTDTVDTDTDATTDELIVVTDVAGLNGFFSDGVPDEYDVTYNTCGRRAGEGRGDCMKVVYNRDPDNNGVGPAYSGWFFLDPANDTNTAWEDGPAIPLGGTAATVTFWAWGEMGGELVNFKAGIGGDANGGEINRDITLTTTPTMYTIDVSSRGWTQIFGPFGFATTTAPLNNQTWTFYVDDIVWNEAEPDTDTDMGDELIAVTDVSVLAGFFSDGVPDSYDVTYNTCGQRVGMSRGDCMKVVYNRDPDNNGVGPAYSGWFFLDPANDVSTAWENGPAVQLGGTATSVTFWAWGETGGELVNFKAGIGGDANGGEINRDITLTTTPTMYTIDVSARGWTQIYGTFGFATTTAPLNNQAWTFYVDDIVWN